MLVIVSTPIGNLGDFSSRAQQALSDADIIACEDTRMTKKLISLCAVQTKAKLLPYHDHNGAEMRPRLMKALQEGKIVALVSDAGTPLISDPGYKLVADCHAAAIKVSAVPGPSAPVMALTLSGLPSDRFMFHGFVPAKTAAARQQITESAGLTATQIWFETPQRLTKTLAVMAEIYGPRRAVIARELTKLHESVTRGRLTDLAQLYAEQPPVKGELVMLIEGADKTRAAASEEEAAAILTAGLQHGSLKDAVRDAEKVTGWPHRRLYQLALSLDKKG